MLSFLRDRWEHPSIKSVGGSYFATKGQFNLLKTLKICLCLRSAMFVQIFCSPFPVCLIQLKHNEQQAKNICSVIETLMSYCHDICNMWRKISTSEHITNESLCALVAISLFFLFRINYPTGGSCAKQLKPYFSQDFLLLCGRVNWIQLLVRFL